MQLLADIAQAALQATRLASIPVREPSYTKPSFWALPLTITRARGLEVMAGAWQDFLEIPSIQDHPKVVTHYVATPFVAGTVEYRFVIKGTLLDPSAVTLPPAVERHLDRFATHPFPTKKRPLYIRVGDTDSFVIQARNLTGVEQLAFAAVYGWYYPQLLNAARGGGEGIDDTARNF